MRLGTVKGLAGSSVSEDNLALDKSNLLFDQRRFSFANFVEGSSNLVAKFAALSVANGQASYNPLFIFSGIGLGKTHLLKAIESAVQKRTPHLRPLYVTAESFTNELINAIRHDETSAFRRKYRTVDMLLVDDVQAIASKERAQEELFHTFNALYDENKHIVITANCPPKRIRPLQERLLSRFEWGHVAEMIPPDLETKRSIIERKAALEGIRLGHEVIEFLAGCPATSIREIEGYIIRLAAMAALSNKEISIALATEVFQQDRPRVDLAIRPELIQVVVAKEFGLEVRDLLIRSNLARLAFPRQVAMYLCKALTPLDYRSIGQFFGGKNHSTVLHSVQKITRLVEKDAAFGEQINRLICRTKEQKV